MENLDHLGLIGAGFDYHFQKGPNYLDDMEARRAEFLAYQTYPANTVQGAGTLVKQHHVPGAFFSVLQSAQVVQNPMAILADLLAGGTVSGTLQLQPLINSSGS